MTIKQKAEIKSFVGTMLLDGGAIREQMCWKEADETIKAWKSEGIELPDKLTPYYLATTWNEMIGGKRK